MKSLQLKRYRAFYLCILGAVVIVASYFLPFGVGKCNELSPCGETRSNAEIFIETFRSNTFSFADMLFLLPLLMAIMFVILGWFYLYHPSHILFPWMLGIWIVSFIPFMLLMLFSLVFAQPSFGFWGYCLGYGILFVALLVFGSAHDF